MVRGDTATAIAADCNGDTGGDFAIDGAVCVDVGVLRTWIAVGVRVATPLVATPLVATPLVATGLGATGLIIGRLV